MADGQAESGERPEQLLAEQMRTAHTVSTDRGIPLASNQVQHSLLHRHPEASGVLVVGADPVL
jgi:hypothetical protein